MIHREYWLVFWVRTVGNFLILSAVAGAILTFWPAAESEVNYRYQQTTGTHYILANTAKADTNLLASRQTQLTITPASTDFGIVILKIGANAAVIANVDPDNQGAYTRALRRGVAHAVGTAYPGQIGNTYLFAHSAGNFWEMSRFNAVFYLLKELDPGDEINIFYQGKRFDYLVYDKQIVEANAVEYLSPQANFAKLTLQTCWPPGTALKRLLVFGRLK